MNKHDKLWNEASDLMMSIDLKYDRTTNMSLDEYLAQEEIVLTSDEESEIQELLNKFNEL